VRHPTSRSPFGVASSSVAEAASTARLVTLSGKKSRCNIALVQRNCSAVRDPVFRHPLARGESAG
jgi:hypothetical protein